MEKLNGKFDETFVSFKRLRYFYLNCFKYDHLSVEDATRLKNQYIYFLVRSFTILNSQSSPDLIPCNGFSGALTSGLFSIIE